MVVRFRWGNSILELPLNESEETSDKNRITTEMRNYLVGEDNKFISYFNNAKRQLQQDGEGTDDLVMAFSVIFRFFKII